MRSVEGRKRRDAFTPGKATIFLVQASAALGFQLSFLWRVVGTREGGWFRLEALNMSDLILSQRTQPAPPHALYFAIRTNISSPAAPRDLGAERLINASYDERARHHRHHHHHHDSPTATLDEAGRDLPFVSFGLGRLDFPPISAASF